jgi:hypothetical protein
MKTVLLCVVAGAALWLTGNALYKLWRYAALTACVEAAVSDWRVEERGSVFVMTAQVSYSWKEKVYGGRRAFEEPRYLNLPSAEQALRQWEGREVLTIWVDPKKGSRSEFQKFFPLKQLIYALISLGIAGFFTAMLSREERGTVSDNFFLNILPKKKEQGKKESV